MLGNIIVRRCMNYNNCTKKLFPVRIPWLYTTKHQKSCNKTLCTTRQQLVAGQISPDQTCLKESYMHQLSSIPLSGKTIGQILDDSAETFPDRVAVIHHTDKRRLTFAEFKEQVDKLATGFLALGLNLGDRVGVWGQNHVEWLITFYAALKAGLIIVNVNPAYKSSELQYALNKVKMKAIVMMPEFKTSNYYEIMQDILPEIDHCDFGQLAAENAPSLTHVIMT